MPRRYGRKKRRPRARKAIDKSQNRRIRRLEEATERKFAISPSAQVALSSTVTNTSQIYSVLPQVIAGAAGGGPQASGMIGNQISLRNVRCDFSLVNTLVTGQSVRVIFFWLTVPRTWATTATTDPPGAAVVGPTWQQLLNGFVIEPTSTNGLVNMTAPHQMITDSNKTPIIRLSDKVYHLGGKESSNSVKHFSFSKSYKGMKLTYNQYSLATAGLVSPVNRQLFVAMVPQYATEVDDTVLLSLSSSMRYTDA
jgi:hypothetical protein